MVALQSTLQWDIKTAAKLGAAEYVGLAELAWQLYVAKLCMVLYGEYGEWLLTALSGWKMYD